MHTFAPHGRGAWRSGAGAGLALLFGACAATPPERLTADGREVHRLAPAPFRIGILPITDAGGHLPNARDDRLGFVLDAASLRASLAASMAAEFHAASEVRVVDSDAADVDVLLRVALEGPPVMQYEGGTDGLATSVILWAATLLGGSFVDDCTYRVEMPLSCALFEPGSPDDPMARLQLRAFAVDLDYWDRVSVPGGLLWSFFVPHCWTTDNLAITSRSLTDGSVRSLAASVSRFLKTEFEPQAAARVGKVEFRAPANGSRCAANHVPLRCTVFTPDRPQRVELYCSGQAEPLRRLEGAELQQACARSAGGYELAIDQTFDLSARAVAADAHIDLILRVTAGALQVSRTLRLELLP
jgi:hypothetical protein